MNDTVVEPVSGAPLHVQLHAVGLLAPGCPGWPASRAMLGGEQAYQPAELSRSLPLPLPRNEARRVTLSIRLALQVAWEALTAAGIAGDEVSAVFACSGGNIEAMDRWLTTLALPKPPVSPVDFNNLVHNAAAGYWAIASGSRQPSLSLSAYDGSFSAGLLEAASQVVLEQGTVLLVAGDAPALPPLGYCRPLQGPFATALLLRPPAGPVSAGQLAVQLDSDQPPTTMSDPGLEQLRAHNPAGRSLPLLRLLAAGQAGTVILPYLSGCTLRLDYGPDQ